MPIVRSAKGRWEIQPDRRDRRFFERMNSAYREAVPKYLSCFDIAFQQARERSEFEFILSLLRPRGVQPPGWDPYETTLDAIDKLLRVHDGVKETDAESARHLQLWLYGHILEASEPYELLANLIDVANGGRYKIIRFPDRKWRPQTPGEKIRQIGNWALIAQMPQVVTPLIEVWDRTLRNAIFHADYVLYGPKVRTFAPYREYPHDEITTLVNRALAYHKALANLHRNHIASYEEPKVIEVHPEFSADPNEKAIVIVRKGHGAIGLKDAWSRAELAAGRIPFRVGKFYRGEDAMLDADPELALLPSRKRQKAGWITRIVSLVRRRRRI
jgi:hypothetical protein